MRVSHKLKRTRRYTTLRHVSIAAGVAVYVLIAAYMIQFFWPRSQAFSFSKVNCFSNPMLLPKLASTTPDSNYEITMTKSIKIGGYPIYSHTTCVKPIRPLATSKSGMVKLRALGVNLFSKSIHITPSNPPSLTNMDIFKNPLPSQEPLLLNMESADLIHEYQLAANGKNARCAMKDKQLTCEVAKLELAQSTQYELVLQRLFNGEVASEVFKQIITTIDPLHMTASSVVAGQTIYDVPTNITMTFDKVVASFADISLEMVTGETRQKISTTISKANNTLVVTFTEPLPRSASFVLTLGSVIAPDGSYLPNPYAMPFSTSGGPKVSSVSIGSYKVATSSSITLTFDNALNAAQAANEFVHIESGGSVLAAAVTKKGRTITIKPAIDLPRCTAFTIKVLDGLKNEAGISGGSAWQFKSRTICQTVFSIGTSVQGRSITGYKFGSGPSKIIFMGTLHGNEKSATSLLTRWIDTLESGADRIPANRTIIVIPSLNPDGYSANQRTNANNVDLNRNFPANDWKSGVTMPDGSFLPNGGGTTSLSEPESKAIANYVLSQNPRVVLSYHAAGAIVSPNESGDSQALASNYARLSTVGYLNSSQTGTFFAYDTTGSFENWLHDKHNIPSLIVELTTKTGNEYSGHQNALWYIAQLP